jgi:hypothetical protein
MHTVSRHGTQLLRANFEAGSINNPAFIRNERLQTWSNNMKPARKAGGRCGKGSAVPSTKQGHHSCR